MCEPCGGYAAVSLLRRLATPRGSLVRAATMTAVDAPRLVADAFSARIIYESDSDGDGATEALGQEVEALERQVRGAGVAKIDGGVSAPPRLRTTSRRRRRETRSVARRSRASATTRTRTSSWAPSRSCGRSAAATLRLSRRRRNVDPRRPRASPNAARRSAPRPRGRGRRRRPSPCASPSCDGPGPRRPSRSARRRRSPRAHGAGTRPLALASLGASRRRRYHSHAAKLHLRRTFSRRARAAPRTIRRGSPAAAPPSLDETKFVFGRLFQS